MVAKHNQSLNLDIEKLRAIGILMVLWNHLFPYLLLEGSKWGIVWQKTQKYFCGWSGVDLFLTVSGFIISKTLVDSISNSRKEWSLAEGGGVIVRFWVRRFYRLFPSAAFWLAVTCVGCLTFNKSEAFGQWTGLLPEVLSFLFSVRNIAFGYLVGSQLIGSYWSLSLEDQFYFFLPLFLFFVRADKWRIRFLWLVIASQFFVFRKEWGLLWHIRTDSLAWGVLLFYFSKTPFYKEVEPRFLESRFKAMAVFLVLLFALAFVPQTLVQLPFSVGLTAIITAIFVWIASYNRDYTLPIGRTFFQYVGNRSYGIYLAHNPAFYFSKEICYRYAHAHSTGISDSYAPFLVVIGLALTAIFAEFSYRWIETPLRDLGKKVASQIGITDTVHDRSLPILERRQFSDMPNSF